MHKNFLFDLDQTLLNFHASEKKALGIVLTENGLSYSEEIYRDFKSYNKSLWLQLEKGTITRPELRGFFMCSRSVRAIHPLLIL